MFVFVSVFVFANTEYTLIDQVACPALVHSPLSEQSIQYKLALMDHLRQTAQPAQLCICVLSVFVFVIAFVFAFVSVLVFAFVCMYHVCIML